MQYEDLPEWAQPGARAAHSTNGGVEPVTVSHVTKTQIVAKSARGIEYRYEREPATPHYGEKWDRPRYKQRGEWGHHLMSLDEPRVQRDLMRSAIRSAMLSVETSVDGWSKYRIGRRPEEKRPLDEVAMEELDAIENAVRAARRKIEGALERYAPGASLAK